MLLGLTKLIISGKAVNKVQPCKCGSAKLPQTKEKTAHLHEMLN